MAALALQSLDEIGQSTPMNERNWKGTGKALDSFWGEQLQRWTAKAKYSEATYASHAALKTPISRFCTHMVIPQLEAREADCGQVLNFGRALR
jgi:hypothetical protein